MATVAVVACTERELERAQALAAALGVPDLGVREDWRSVATHAFLLIVAPEGLAIGRTAKGRTRPVRVDFGAPSLLHRLRDGGARSESVARALGLPAPRRLQVVDATAGLGGDSAVLAALGCAVVMIERHPLVAALLDDGLQRARASPEPRVRELASRMELLTGDATTVLRDWAAEAPDAVLLDPMFPERRGTAAVRGEMQLFHSLIGEDGDAAGLLQAALGCARFRVAVKRPLAAPALEGPRPSHQSRGRSTRFDVYVKARIV